MRTWIAVLAVGAVGWSASAAAAPPPGPPAAAPASASAPSVASAPSPAASPAPAPALVPPTDVTAPAPVVVGPVPTADEIPAPSDHDAVVGHIGIEARRFDPGPMPLALRDGLGCPMGAAGTAACEVTMGAIAVRYWWTRNLALNAGAAIGAGGGRNDTRSLDTYLGIGPIVGMSLLLGNWKHLSVAASPQLALVWFKPSVGGVGSDSGSTTMLALQAAVEAEVHLGFVGVPALSIGLLAGLGFQYESVAGTRLWSVGVMGGDSIWGALSNLFVRYYL